MTMNSVQSAPPVPVQFDEHKALLESSGLVERAVGVMNINRVVIDPSTIEIHRIVGFETGVVPYQAIRQGERRVLLVVDKKMLEKEGITEKEFHAKAEEVLIEQVDVDVVDLDYDF